MLVLLYRWFSETAKYITISNIITIFCVRRSGDFMGAWASHGFMMGDLRLLLPYHLQNLRWTKCFYGTFGRKESGVPGGNEVDACFLDAGRQDGVLKV